MFLTNLDVVTAFPYTVNSCNLLLADPAVVNLEYIHFLLLVQTVLVHSDNCLCTPAAKHTAIISISIFIIIIIIIIIREILKHYL